MTAQATPRAKLVCRNVWKLFGTHAAELLAASGGSPSAQQLQAAGVVAAVRDVNLDVREGEIFVIMAFRAPASRRWCAACRASSNPPRAK